MSRWAYPAKPDLEDVSIHGNTAAHIEVDHMVRMEGERQFVQTLIVCSVQRRENKTGEVPSVFLEDWTEQYMECDQFADTWEKSLKGEFDDQTRLYKGKLVRNGRWCIPMGLTRRVAQEFHS